MEAAAVKMKELIDTHCPLYFFILRKILRSAYNFLETFGRLTYGLVKLIIFQIDLYFLPRWLKL